MENLDNIDINKCLNDLQKSKFRASFKLKKIDFDYIDKRGLDVIKSHAKDFIKTRLAPAQPTNDGKQTPMHGHPAFVAQHATATCCRGCFERWWHIKKGHMLTESEQNFAVNLVMGWISRQIETNKSKE